MCVYSFLPDFMSPLDLLVTISKSSDYLLNVYDTWYWITQMYLTRTSLHLCKVLRMMFYKHDDTNGGEREEWERGGTRENDKFSKHKQWSSLIHFKRQSSQVVSAFWKFYYSLWAIFIKRWIKDSWNQAEKNGRKLTKGSEARSISGDSVWQLIYINFRWRVSQPTVEK